MPATAAFPSNCDRPDDGIPELCAAVGRVAVRREVMVAVCDSNVITQLEVFLSATKKANITNVMVIALDRKLAGWLDAQDPPVAYWLRPDAAKGSHKISAQKFKFIGAVLSVGASALVTDIDVVYVQDPFRFFWRDSDVEGTTDGWDPATAYGWTEQNDDAPLGWARYSYAHRSTAWNSGLWFVQATAGGARLMALLAHRMATENYVGPDRVQRGGRAAGAAVALGRRRHAARRQLSVLRQLEDALPPRATLGRALQPIAPSHRLSHVNYHQPKPTKMRADPSPSTTRATTRRARRAVARAKRAAQHDDARGGGVDALNGGFVLGRTLGESSRAVLSWARHARRRCSASRPAARRRRPRRLRPAAAVRLCSPSSAPAPPPPRARARPPSVDVAAAADAVVLDAFVAAAAAVEVGAPLLAATDAVALTAARAAVEAHGAASITMVDASETEGANGPAARRRRSRGSSWWRPCCGRASACSQSRRGWCCCATRR